MIVIMKAILSVVAIITLAATISAEIFEYSDEKFLEMPLVDLTSEVFPATVINPDIKRNLKRARWEVEENTVTLVSNLAPNQGEEEHPICKGSLGIDLQEVGKSTYCDLNLIRVRMRVSKQHSDKYFMVLSLGFGFGPENKPLALEIPVFNTPSEYASPDQKQQFAEWALENGLSTVPPLDIQQLNELLDDSEITNDFIWLEKLISFGIFERPRKIILQKEDEYFEIESYVTLPLVLSRGITNKLVELVVDAQTKTAIFTQLPSQER